MKAESTIKSELRKVVEGKTAAVLGANKTEREDWLYGAETALAWALDLDVMAPSKAFAKPKDGE